MRSKLDFLFGDGVSDSDGGTEAEDEDLGGTAAEPVPKPVEKKLVSMENPKLREQAVPVKLRMTERLARVTAERRGRALADPSGLEEAGRGGPMVTCQAGFRDGDGGLDARATASRCEGLPGIRKSVSMARAAHGASRAAAGPRHAPDDDAERRLGESGGGGASGSRAAASGGASAGTAAAAAGAGAVRQATGAAEAASAAEVGPERPRCASCGLPVRQPLCCARCLGVSYCNKECQRQDWSFHKLGCQDWKLLAAAAEPALPQPASASAAPAQAPRRARARPGAEAARRPEAGGGPLWQEEGDAQGHPARGARPGEAVRWEHPTGFEGGIRHQERPAQPAPAPLRSFEPAAASMKLGVRERLAMLGMA